MRFTTRRITSTYLFIFSNYNILLSSISIFRACTKEKKGDGGGGGGKDGIYIELIKINVYLQIFFFRFVAIYIYLSFDSILRADD